MKKIMNEAGHFVDEMLQGILAAHPGQLAFVAGDLRCIVKSGSGKKNKVGIATGGGSAICRFSWVMWVTGCWTAVQLVVYFNPPVQIRCWKSPNAIDQGSGVLYIYGNYGGDIMNFDMAAEMADMEGIHVEQVIAGEDVASAPKGEEGKRRGVAGIFYVFKIAGALADELAPLAEVKRVAKKPVQMCGPWVLH